MKLRFQGSLSFFVDIGKTDGKYKVFSEYNFYIYKAMASSVQG